MRKNGLSFRFFLIIFVYFLSMRVNSSMSPSLAPALYVFGDSMLDGGANNFLPTLIRANYPPYGVDFPEGATGRFTNGRLLTDFMAEFLGLPFPAPYKTEKLKTLTGLNYASSGCGILPITGMFLGKCLSLDNQMDLFEGIIEKELPIHYKNAGELGEYLSKSIIMINIGSNDYLNNFGAPLVYALNQFRSQSFHKILTDALSQRLQRLYKLGIRKVVVFGLGPIGCIPWIRKQFTLFEGQCAEDVNKLIVTFNKELATMVNTLNASLKDSHFVLGRVYSPSKDAILNPSKYGLRDSSNSCCATTGINGPGSCIPQSKPCRDPYKHFFWDEFHPSETVFSFISTHCFNGTGVCVPMNIKELAQV